MGPARGLQDDVDTIEDAYADQVGEDFVLLDDDEEPMLGFSIAMLFAGLIALSAAPLLWLRKRRAGAG